MGFFASWQRYCTASSSGRQANFAALNRGRHLCSVGRPSGWALAHILVITVVIVLVSYCQSYCDFARTFYSRHWFVLHALLLLEQCLIVLSRYKCRDKYLLCGRAQSERTGVDSLNFFTVSNSGLLFSDGRLSQQLPELLSLCSTECHLIMIVVALRRWRSGGRFVTLRGRE